MAHGKAMERPWKGTYPWQSVPSFFVTKRYLSEAMYPYRSLPVQAGTGGRSGVSVYKAGRSVPLDSAQLDLSRLALPQLGSVGVEKMF